MIVAFYVEELTSDYLIGVLTPALELTRSLDDRLDVDAAESAEAVANMIHCIRQIVVAVCDSVDDAPPFIQYISFLIHQTMVQLHPRQCKQVAASSFCLRVTANSRYCLHF